MIDVDIIDLPGRVLFPDGTEHDFTLRCRGDRMEVVLAAGVEFGAALVCHVAGLGIVEGHAGAATGAGRVLDLRASPAHRARLAARVAWHRRRAAGLDDQRASQRVAASAAAVRVRCASGVEMAGTMIDLSATGAALRVTARPAIGTAVVVGRRRATVVRHLDDGVAVQFALPLRPQDVTPETVL